MATEKDSFKIEAFSNEDCKIEYILHLPSIIAHSGVDNLEEFMEDNYDDRSQKSLIECNKAFEKFFEEIGDTDDLDIVSEALDSFDINNGFLFKVSTPIKTRGSGKSYSWSWGHTTFAWLWAESIEAGELACIEWAKKTGFIDKCA